jgi:hypothetical protein
LDNAHHFPNPEVMHAVIPETENPDEGIKMDIESELRSMRYRQSLLQLLHQLGAE